MPLPLVCQGLCLLFDSCSPRQMVVVSPLVAPPPPLVAPPSLVHSMHGSCLCLSLEPLPLVNSASHCQQVPHVASAVTSHHYVDRTGCHIYNWSAPQCSTYLGYTRKVTHQIDIFQITILEDLQGIVHQSMYKSNGYWYLVCWLTGRGSSGKMRFFQMAPIPLLSVLICSTRCYYKTDKSKRKGVCFWWEQKLQPDRPHPNQEFVLRKTDFIFLHTSDKHCLIYCRADKHQ